MNKADTQLHKKINPIAHNGKPYPRENYICQCGEKGVLLGGRKGYLLPFTLYEHKDFKKGSNKELIKVDSCVLCN